MRASNPPRSLRSPWQQSEQRIAAHLGGRRTPASGSRPGLAGDIVTATCVIEHKYTERPYFSLRLAWLRKIVQEAKMTGKTPALTFEIHGAGVWLLTRAFDADAPQEPPTLRILPLTRRQSLRLSPHDLPNAREDYGELWIAWFPSPSRVWRIRRLFPAKFDLPHAKMLDILSRLRLDGLSVAEQQALAALDPDAIRRHRRRQQHVLAAFRRGREDGGVG